MTPPAAQQTMASMRPCTPTSSTTLDAFTDAASVESWAADAMRWANGTGLVTGVTPTTLVPNGTATRAQVAVILSRYTGK